MWNTIIWNSMAAFDHDSVWLRSKCHASGRSLNTNHKISQNNVESSERVTVMFSKMVVPMEEDWWVYLLLNEVCFKIRKTQI